uniref:type VI secretion system Vgr family protein n=1 Tax=Azovibrio restrictus TaxID=146938 RepID=UPI00047E85C5
MAAAFSQANRLLKLSFAADAGLADDTLLPFELQGWEHCSEGYAYALDCLAADAHLELKQFIGVPAQLSLRTDDGQERALCGLVTEARQEGSNGGFARYRLILRDPLAVLALRHNSRVFQDLSVREFVAQILREHQEANPVLQACFELDDRCTGKHPPQSWVTQYNESDTHFIQRWLAQEGISWFCRHGDGGRPGQAPRITLVLFDDPQAAFTDSTAPQVRFHRNDGSETEDGISEWFASRELQPGSTFRASYDYKPVQVQDQEDQVSLVQGKYGDSLAATLEDYHYDTSHAANDPGDYDRYGRLREQAYQMAGKTFTGRGSQRELSVGHCFELLEHPVHDQGGSEARRFALIRISLYVRNNLPAELEASLGQGPALPQPFDPRLDALLATLARAENQQTLQDLEHPVLRNQFDCVRVGIPILPLFAGTAHAKPVAPSLLIGIVVGPEGEEIHTDELGRIKVRMPFTRQADHAHAQGAGATDSDRDSQWIRVVQPWSGTEYGGLFIPRVGDEVIISYVGGDIDRPIVTGTVYNGTHRPATASHAGNLPGNRKLAALKSKMYKGNGANELLWDDTT